MPSASRVRLATPLSSRIIGFIAMPNQRTGPAATFAVASGSDTARVLGTISPTIIENTVAISMASTDATDEAVDADRPSDSSGPSSSTPIDGLARKPSTSVVRVMPSWHAESWVESRRSEVSTDRAPGSPASTAFCTVGRSRATSENSAATNRAVPSGEDDAEEQQQPCGHGRTIRLGTVRGRFRDLPRGPRQGAAGSTGRLTLTLRGGCKDGGMTPRGTTDEHGHRDRGAIEIRGLTKRFGSFIAVDDLSFDVEPGRITGFLGPNGAGKTTTLRMLLGLVRPTSGTATIGGQRYHDIPRRVTVVGAALEATNFHPGRSGRDHLRVLADAGRRARTRRVDEMLELAGIPAAARKRAGGYSMGMRQRLGLAAALLGDPQVLILDEPANGLDPEGIRWLRGFLRHLADEGKTVLISSHLLQEVEQTVDDVVIIANGRLVRPGRDGRPARRRPRPSSAPPTASASPGALRVADVTEHAGDDGALVADTTDLRLVGDVALRAGLPDLRAAPSHDRPRGAVLRAHRGHQPQPRARPAGAPPERDAIDRTGRGEPMTAAIRAEFRKFFTTRMWWGMAIAIFVAGARLRRPVRLHPHRASRPQRPRRPATRHAAQIANSVYTGRLASATC